MGGRVAGVIIGAGAVLVAVLAPVGRAAIVVTRPACAEEYENGRPTGWCQNWPDAPVPAPTSSYDGRAPAVPADRRPVEQGPTCWITDAGWPRCYERTDTP